MAIMNYDPYKYGRWFKIFVESDGSDHTITTSDIDDLEIVDDYIVMPNGDWVIADVKCFVSTDSPSQASADKNYGVLGVTTTGEARVKIPPVTAYTDATIFVFGYKK